MQWNVCEGVIYTSIKVVVSCKLVTFPFTEARFALMYSSVNSITRSKYSYKKNKKKRLFSKRDGERKGEKRGEREGKPRILREYHWLWGEIEEQHLNYLNLNLLVSIFHLKKKMSELNMIILGKKNKHFQGQFGYFHLFAPHFLDKLQSRLTLYWKILVH